MSKMNVRCDKELCGSSETYYLGMIKVGDAINRLEYICTSCSKMMNVDTMYIPNPSEYLDVYWRKFKGSSQEVLRLANAHIAPFERAYRKVMSRGKNNKDKQ